MAPTRKNATDDSRHPDTAADQGPKAEDYGFRTIEGTEPAEGPGVVEPIREPALNTDGDNSTFATRAKSRGGNRAVQPAQTESKTGPAV